MEHVTYPRADRFQAPPEADKRGDELSQARIAVTDHCLAAGGAAYAERAF